MPHVELGQVEQLRQFFAPEPQRQQMTKPACMITLQVSAGVDVQGGRSRRRQVLVRTTCLRRGRAFNLAVPGARTRVSGVPRSHRCLRGVCGALGPPTVARHEARRRPRWMSGVVHELDGQVAASREFLAEAAAGCRSGRIRTVHIIGESHEQPCGRPFADTGADRRPVGLAAVGGKGADSVRGTGGRLPDRDTDTARAKIKCEQHLARCSRDRRCGAACRRRRGVRVAQAWPASLLSVSRLMPSRRAAPCQRWSTVSRR